MISRDMRNYDYLLFQEDNEYGAPSMSEDVKGQIKMAINSTSTTIQDNINYKDAQYIGLTHANVNDNFVIKFDGGALLKVLYVNPKGRYKQAFLKKI